MGDHEHGPASELIWTPADHEAVPELTWTPHESPAESEAPAAAVGPLAELPAGSPVVIPDGYVGLVVLPDGQGGTLPPGRHGVLEAQACCLLLPTRWERLGYSRPLLVTDNRRQGMLVAMADVSLELMALDATMFAGRVLREGAQLGSQAVGQGRHRSFGDERGAAGEAVSFAQANFAQLAVELLLGGIEDRLTQAAYRLGFDPASPGHQRAALAHAAGPAVAQVAAYLGLNVRALQVHDLRQVHRMPCRRCGSVTAPTGYACFRRNISIAPLRFTREEHGHYCVRCALAQGLLDTVITATVGWFGVIGLVLTPCYVAANLGNLAALLVRPKAPTLEDEARI